MMGASEQLVKEETSDKFLTFCPSHSNLTLITYAYMHSSNGHGMTIDGNIIKDLGDLLRQRRHILRLSQAEVANNAHISVSLYSLIETGKRIASKAVLNDIVATLHFSPAGARKLDLLTAAAKGLAAQNAGLSDEIHSLLLEIRNSANCLPAGYIKALRQEIREIAK